MNYKPNFLKYIFMILIFSFSNLFAQNNGKINFDDFWLDFSTALGNNARGNVIKKDIANMTNFPLEMNEDGTLIKYNQKKFLKDFKKIFAVEDKLFMSEVTEFKTFKADKSYSSSGVELGSTMYYLLIDNTSLTWNWYKYYFGLVKGKYKLIYVETGI